LSAPRTLSEHWPVAPALLVGLAIRVAIVLLHPDMPLHADERAFWGAGLQAAAGEEVGVFPFRPPLYVGFCAAVAAVFGDSPDALRFAQCGVDVLMVLGVWLLARRMVGRRTAVWAAWLAALYPDFIVYSHYLWSETLGLCLLTWALLALTALHDRPSVGRAVVVGLAFGALNHVKPFHTYMLPLLMGTLVAMAAPGARLAMVRHGVVAVLALAAACAPWSIHQSLKTGRTVVVSTSGAKNLREGLNEVPPVQLDFASEWFFNKRKRSRAPKDRATGLEFVVRNPGLFASRTVEKMSYLWAPNSYLLRYLYLAFPPGQNWKYGPAERMDPGLRRGVAYASIGSTVVLALGLVLGLFGSRARTAVAMTATYVLAYMGMIALTPSLSRYRLPLMIFAVVWTAALLARDSRPGRLRGRPGLAAGAFAALAALAVLWSMRLPAILHAVH